MNDGRLTRVAIVSDQAIYLRGLAALVMSIRNVNLVGEARNAAETVQLCHITEPEFLLLALRDPFEQTLELVRQIHYRWPVMKMILLSGSSEETPVEGSMDPLPVYVFSREMSEAEFKAAFDQVCRAEVPEGGVQGMGQTHFQHQVDEEPVEDWREAFTLGSRGIQPRSPEMLTRELTMAGKIQASILPEVVPEIPGWEIAARLEPARETSGDFYDFLPLTDRKWGLVVADVTDKGMGAALFMALSSTLIRTYTNRYPTLPALALSAVSERILSDTGGSMFVTAFFGILEPFTGRFVYANAGHPPGFVISTQRGKDTIERLRPTGMALGVSEQAQWKQKVAKLSPGDVLILYTDGVIEAESPDGVFFGEDRLLDVALAKANCTAHEIQAALLEEVRRFVGNVPHQDDVALIVIRREK